MARQTREDVIRNATIARAEGYLPSFRCWDLRGVDLSGLSLVRGNFDCADLSGANLTGADLHAADLHGTTLQDADLTNADLSDARLCFTRLEGANLTNTNLFLTWFVHSHYLPEQLLDTRGLQVRHSAHNISTSVWDSILPKGPGAQRLLEEMARRFEHSTLRERIEATTRILPADPAGRELLFELLDDWDGTVEEAATTAATLRTA